MAKFDINKIRRDNPLSTYLPRRGIKLVAEGKEWLCHCPLVGPEKTPSFTIYKSRKGGQQFQCFGCGAHGDVIDFVCQYDGVEFVEACEILDGKREVSSAPRPVAQIEPSFDPYEGYDQIFPPPDAPLFVAGEKTVAILNPKRAPDGKPQMVTYRPSLVHPYRNAAGRLTHYVLRVDIGSRKITPQIVYYRNKVTGFRGWSHGAAKEPRGLYGHDQIAAHPERQKIVVEGEKCKDAAARLLPQLVAVSWAGGGKGYGKTDFAPLVAGKSSAIFWADNDAEGEATMLGAWTAAGHWRKGVVERALDHGLERAVYIGLNPDMPKGWDIADAEGKMSDEDIVAYMRAQGKVLTHADIEARKQRTSPHDTTSRQEPQTEQRTVEQAKPAQKPPAAKPEARGNIVAIHGAAIPPGDEDEDWRAQMLFGEDGPRKRSMENFIIMCRSHPSLRGVFIWNDFDRNIYVAKRPPWDKGKGEWTIRKTMDGDVISCTGFLERHHLSPKPNEVGQALIVASRARSFNPVKGWLESLQWDGIPRVKGGMWEGAAVAPWMTEYLGAKDTKINRAFGARWLIAAVARVIEPGCKVDNMLILEGPQGKKKSMAFEVLATINGEKYFNGNMGDIESKDAVMVMQDVWIIEEAELTMLDRKQSNQIKSWMTVRNDRLRLPYGKHTEKYPRHTIFGGTVNPSGMGYLKDPTGARRFWPVACGDIDITRLEQDQPQIWAEAVDLYRKGVKWWLTPEEDVLAREVQEERYEQEAWADLIDEYLRGSGLKEITTTKILTEAISVPRERHNQIYQKRVADHLAQRGFKRVKKRIDLDTNPKWCFVKDGVDDIE